MVRENLTSLTSLRFFAAASIVWLHSKLYFEWARVGPDLPFDHGVSFFFVLSGFILTHVHGSGKISFWLFMKGRIARLWPLHISCLLAVLFIVRHDSQSFDGPGLQSKWVSIIPNALLLQSWWPSKASAFSWNSVSWSISTEMFFYAAFPLLIALLANRKILFAMAILLPIPLILVAAWALGVPSSGDVFTVTRGDMLYSFPPGRLSEFAIGVLACRVWQRVRIETNSGIVFSSAIEISAVLMLIVWFGWLLPELKMLTEHSHVSVAWFVSTSSFVVFAVFIPMMASGRGIVGRMLTNRGLILLGENSFALYMVHQIIMKVVVISAPSLGSPIFVLAACTGIALAAHFSIERYGRSMIMKLGVKS